MQICKRVPVGPLTFLRIVICESQSGGQMGHSVTDMQEKRETSCAPHKHPALGGFQGTRKMPFFLAFTSPPTQIYRPLMRKHWFSALWRMGWEKKVQLMIWPKKMFCSDFWSGFWSEFEQQERRQDCGSQLDGFGSGLKLRPLTGHHHHYHPDHLAYFLSLYFVVFFVLVFVFAQTAPSNRSPPPPWPPCSETFCLCIFCVCVCICPICAF